MYTTVYFPSESHKVGYNGKQCGNKDYKVMYCTVTFNVEELKLLRFRNEEMLSCCCVLTNFLHIAQYFICV